MFKQISVAARIPELQQGHVDLLAASLTHNKEREALVDFSYSIIVTGQKALVKKNAGFASLHDLDGKKVLTVKGGTQEPNIRKALPNAQVVTFETSQQALLALQQGRVRPSSTTSRHWSTISASSARRPAATPSCRRT